MTKRVISSAYGPLLVKVSWKTVAWATTANVAETPVVLLNEDHNESSGDTGGFFPFLNIAHLVKIILTINWMSKVDKIINQDGNTFLCLFSNTKYIICNYKDQGMDTKLWSPNSPSCNHVRQVKFYGQVIINAAIKIDLHSSAEDMTARCRLSHSGSGHKAAWCIALTPYLCPSPLCRVFQCEIGCVFPENINVSLTLLHCSYDKCGKMQMCT